MRKLIFPIIFIIGLGIFLYPIISNLVATTAHQSVIKAYNEKVDQLDEETIEKEKEKLEKHNEELAESDLNFVDPFAESKPDENTETSSGLTSYYDALNIDPAIGSIKIPKIDVAIPIYHGTSEDVLSRGAGHLENSSLPSSELGTHSVITAHRGLPSSKLFRDLNKVQIGDMFFTEVLGETIAYEINSIDIVLPNETNWIQMEADKNKMTLLTCEPYMINSHRMLVTGHQVPYDPKEKVEPEPKSYIIYYIIGALVLLILIIYLIRRKKKRVDAL